MKKLFLSITVFMFVIGGSTVAFAQNPVKNTQPETEQTENKQEAEETKQEAPAEEAKAEEPATEESAS